MKILVTGAAGFISFHTAKALLDRGDEVIGLDNLNSYYDVTLKEARLGQLTARRGFAFMKANLQDRVAIDRFFAEFKPHRVMAKKANELMAHTYAHLYQFPVTGLRFFTVYGLGPDRICVAIHFHQKNLSRRANRCLQ